MELDVVWPDSPSVLVFMSIVLAVLASLVAGVVATAQVSRRSQHATLAVVACVAWLGLTGSIVASSLFDTPQPFVRVAPYAVGSLLAALGLALSPLGRRLSVGISLSWLVGVHALRLPLELVLHRWAEQGTVPWEMTYRGQNFDIVVGMLALVVAPLAERFRWLVWAFEALGLAMLANIVRIVAITTLGSPFYANIEPPLSLAMHMPMTWIVSVCVAGAIAGHIVVLRRLLDR